MNLTGEALVTAHKRAIRKLRILSVLFPLAFISLICAYLAAFAGEFQNVDGPAVGKELSNHAGDLLPEINQSLGEVADAVQPALTRAVEAGSLEMAPQIEQRLQADVDRAIATTRSELKLTVGKSLAKNADAQRALLLKEFPQLAQSPEAQDKVIASMNTATTEWASRQLDATVTEHLTAMDQLRATLQSSYTKPQGQDVDPEDALMAWLNLMNEHVGGNAAILAKNEKTHAPADAARTARKN